MKELMGADIDPAAAAEREWRTDPGNAYGILGEDADASHVRVFGRRAPIQRLLDDGLADHAWTIWEPLLTGGERVAAL